MCIVINTRLTYRHGFLLIFMCFGDKIKIDHQIISSKKNNLVEISTRFQSNSYLQTEFSSNPYSQDINWKIISWTTFRYTFDVITFPENSWGNSLLACAIYFSSCSRTRYSICGNDEKNFLALCFMPDMEEKWCHYWRHFLLQAKEAVYTDIYLLTMLQLLYSLSNFLECWLIQKYVFVPYYSRS